MILHGDVCVGQASHAWMSGQMARAWGNARFARPEPFEDVCLAVEQHDVGMAEWDLAPELGDDGRPLSFLQMPPELHVALWAAAPAKVLTQSPYAALLVSLHGTALQRRRADRPEVAAYLAEQEALQARLRATLSEDAARVEHNRRLLWTLDFLSLALLVEGWMPGEVEAPTRMGEPSAPLRIAPAGPGRATVDPWPFGAPKLHVRCHGRRLTLGEPLDRAPWQALAFALTRA